MVRMEEEEEEEEETRTSSGDRNELKPPDKAP
jgi:hypothetical protein